MFLLALVVLVFVIFAFLDPRKQADLILPAISVAAGWTYFLYSQHLQETKLFLDLFSRFNDRYDRLNDALREILSRDDGGLLSTEKKSVLMDYFNLCAEEYLFYKTGFLDEDVWRSWHCGMLEYASKKNVFDLWVVELKSDSYYGFPVGLITQKLPGSAGA